MGLGWGFLGRGHAGIGGFSAGGFATVAWVREGGVRAFFLGMGWAGWSGCDVLDGNERGVRLDDTVVVVVGVRVSVLDS